MRALENNARKITFEPSKLAPENPVGQNTATCNCNWRSRTSDKGDQPRFGAWAPNKRSKYQGTKQWGNAQYF